MIKRLAAFAASLDTAMTALVAPAAVLAQGGGNFGLDATVKAVNDGTGKSPIFDPSVTPEVLIGRIIQNLLGFIGVIFFLLMLYAGFLWMTARGDDKKVSEAKAIIQASIIGVVVIGAAYAITSFVLTNIAPPQ